MSSRALVLVHGFLGASNNWLGVNSKLRASPDFAVWDLICPDLRWHSGDPRRFESDVPATTAAVAEDLAKTLAQVEARELLVLGHSFGLRPLLKIVAHDMLPGKKILGLIAEDSSPVLSDHGSDQLELILGQTPVPFATREAARQYFDDTFGAASAMSRFLLSNVREDAERGGHTWRFSERILLELLRASRAESLEPEWLSYAGPVYMVVGDRSAHLPHARAEHWQRVRTQRGQRAELAYVAGAGHWVHADQPESFAMTILNILSKVNKLNL